jgi:exonuclease SbcC
MVLIQEIRLLNFQKHKQLKLQFAPGLNVLLGETGQGKTAIIRAIKWLALHEPVSGFMSHGEKTLKVGIRTDRGTVIRFKDSKKYGYKVGDEEFLACAKDQPNDVSEILMLHPYNFQSQHEPYFLLNLTAGQVAKEINRIVALEDIDKANTFLKSRSTRLGTLIQAGREKAEGYQSRLADFADLDVKLALLAKMKGSLESLDAKRNQQLDLSQHLEDIEHSDYMITQETKKISKLSLVLDSASRVEALGTLKQALGSLLSDVQACESLPKLNALVSVLDALMTRQMRLAALGKLIQEVTSSEELISTISREISAKAATGAAIVQKTKAKKDSLENVLGVLKTLRSEFKDAQGVLEQVEQKVKVMQTPVMCKMCKRCVTVCEGNTDE